MGDHLDAYSIHDGSDIPQFHYDGVHKVGPDFDEDMLMAIGKNGTMKGMINSTVIFRTRKGL